MTALPDLDWQADAACIGKGADLFFPTSGEPSAPAKAICRGCPVRVACLEYALEHETTTRGFGVWGGTTAKERDRIRQQRANGLRVVV